MNWDAIGRIVVLDHRQVEMLWSHLEEMEHAAYDCGQGLASTYDVEEPKAVIRRMLGIPLESAHAPHPTHPTD